MEFIIGKEGWTGFSYVNGIKLPVAYGHLPFKGVQSVEDFVAGRGEFCAPQIWNRGYIERVDVPTPLIEDALQKVRQMKKEHFDSEKRLQPPFWRVHDFDMFPVCYSSNAPFEGGCEKVTFPSESAARSPSTRVRRGLKVYQCHLCGMWHHKG